MSRTAAVSRTRFLAAVLAAVLLSSGAAAATPDQPSNHTAPGWCCWVR